MRDRAGAAAAASAAAASAGAAACFATPPSLLPQQPAARQHARLIASAPCTCPTPTAGARRASVVLPRAVAAPAAPTEVHEKELSRSRSDDAGISLKV